MSSENPSRDPKDRQETIGVVRRNWQAEVETAQTYRDLADRERVHHAGRGAAAHCQIDAVPPVRLLRLRRPPVGLARTEHLGRR